MSKYDVTHFGHMCKYNVTQLHIWHVNDWCHRCNRMVSRVWVSHIICTQSFTNMTWLVYSYDMPQSDIYEMTHPEPRFHPDVHYPLYAPPLALYVDVYMYVCMCACMYVCMDVCMYACVCICMFVYMYVWMYVCMYVCMYLCMYA